MIKRRRCVVCKVDRPYMNNGQGWSTVLTGYHEVEYRSGSKTMIPTTDIPDDFRSWMHVNNIKSICAESVEVCVLCKDKVPA